MLQKTFIIATLVSTLVGTFAASHNLYERLNQKKKDENQDGAIKKLEDKMDQMVKKKDEKKDDGDADKDDLKDSLDKSQRLIRREYDVCYDRLGRRFAVGDSECTLQPRIRAPNFTCMRYSPMNQSSQRMSSKSKSYFSNKPSLVFWKMLSTMAGASIVPVSTNSCGLRMLPGRAH